MSGWGVPRQEVSEAQAQGVAQRSPGWPRGRMGLCGGGADESAVCRLRGGCEPQGQEAWGPRGVAASSSSDTG